MEALLAASALHPDALLGSRYTRDGGGRPRDAAWHNTLSPAQLHTQRLRETTLAQPTWAMRRAVFDAVGGYAEAPAEDLRFFYAHLNRGGALHCVDAALLMYRHVAHGVTASRGVPAALIWQLRVEQLERVLATPPWVRGSSGLVTGGGTPPARPVRGR